MVPSEPVCARGGIVGIGRPRHGDGGVEGQCAVGIECAHRKGAAPQKLRIDGDIPPGRHDDVPLPGQGADWVEGDQRPVARGDDGIELKGTGIIGGHRHIGAAEGGRQAHSGAGRGAVGQQHLPGDGPHGVGRFGLAGIGIDRALKRQLEVDRLAVGRNGPGGRDRHRAKDVGAADGEAALVDAREAEPAGLGIALDHRRVFGVVNEPAAIVRLHRDQGDVGPGGHRLLGVVEGDAGDGADGEGMQVDGLDLPAVPEADGGVDHLGAAAHHQVLRYVQRQVRDLVIPLGIGLVGDVAIVVQVGQAHRGPGPDAAVAVVDCTLDAGDSQGLVRHEEIGAGLVAVGKEGDFLARHLAVEVVGVEDLQVHFAHGDQIEDEFADGVGAGNALVRTEGGDDVKPFGGLAVLA